MKKAYFGFYFCVSVGLTYFIWETIFISFGFINFYFFALTSASCFLFTAAVIGSYLLCRRKFKINTNRFLLYAVIGNILVISYFGFWYGNLAGKPNRIDILSNYYIKPNHWETQKSVAVPPRVVVSLSTIPNRVHQLNWTLESLLNQTIKPDAIYLNLPKYSNRLQVPYPQYDCPYPEVTLLDTQDYGPLTKLLPAVMAETDPDTIIITVDDDRIYRSDLVEDLVFHAGHNPTAAIGSSGWSIMRPILLWGMAGTYPSYNMKLDHEEGFLVDVLQGYAGIAYRRKFFNVETLRMSPPECFTLDDVFISGYLSTVSHVRKVTLDKSRVRKVGAEEAKKDHTRLGYINHGAGKMKFMQCINAIENTFGLWETINF